MFKILAGGAAVAAFVSAAPAAAQYYPNPYGYNQGGGGVIGQVINQVLGGGYANYGGGYGTQQAAIGQCVNAVQARINGGGAGYNPYGGYNGAYGGGYGYNGYNTGARVLGISRIEQRSNGGVTIRGVATSGMAAGYGYGYGNAGQGQVDLTFKCKADYRGFISDVDIDRARTAYGSNYGNQYTPYNNAYDYSQYGYRRY
jgi:hypothetical protein